MKITVIIFRTLMGLLFLFGAVAYLFNLVPQPELSGSIKLFMEGMVATGYMMPLIKYTELFCGICFVTNRFAALAAILIAPVIVNILMLNVFLDPSGLPISIFLVVANILVAYSNWPKYRLLFLPK